ncbi:esterase/lipase family protein [Kitasatospora kifunensis]|uniref:Triacylglycerol esterase/lipase EstA (Alpha/beta hydrolase family) n=1 Tax=Kitasatospora kifunensis TaxID=58351 RepID=A0A7W7R4C0_KITKI|nr:alpha/beta fold hydrolase [Kitasatospora kifunensis]MBB4924949.1 triacylglycerol esterase/lipase EstA (alpha/beta hydrolase family) [Kitasatospora kifunensis]
MSGTTLPRNPQPRTTLPRITPPRTRIARRLAALAAGAGLLGTALVGAVPAQARTAAQDTNPISAAQALAAPGVPGANDWSCQPSSAHPRPVVLVHGTFANGSVNWLTIAPALAAQGYCVYALTYGAEPGVPLLRAIAPVADSAQQLSTFVDGVLAATGAGQVDIVGHSQGGMMPRYYLKFDGGAAKVHTLVGLAPSNHGTTLDGLTTLAQSFPGAQQIVASACPACADQEVGSAMLAQLNAGGDTMPGVDYTVIATKYDEVVTPYTSQFLTGPNVHNVLVQDLCPANVPDHVLMAADPVVRHEVMHALDPEHVADATCLANLTG